MYSATEQDAQKAPAVPTKEAPLDPNLKQLIKMGIPIVEAHFHSAVNNGENVPENNFSAYSNSPSRRVQMWYTPQTLVCLHKGKHILVPTASVRFAVVASSLGE